jgi:hypothetical protein
MPNFIPGLELSRLFYEENVQPVLTREFPQLPYSAALLGSGSEVLGFDTPRSTDHHWGPRVLLFLYESDFPRYADEIRERMRFQLPARFRGYSTSYREAPNEPGVMLFEEVDAGPVNHRVEMHTLRDFFEQQLGLDPYDDLTPVDWLTVSEQRLLTVTAGAVYHDGLGELEALRSKFAYYPRDVWLYLLAAQWQRISQEEPFVGRTGDVGDELGSQIIAARLVRDLMRLCFLMEQTYAPYPKWFGTAFSRLEIGSALALPFDRVLHSRDWHEREKYLSVAYTIVAEKHNSLGITEPLSTEVSPFHGRPYLIIHGDVFAEAIQDAIEDPAVRALPSFLGSVDQYVDSTDVLSYPRRYRKLDALYKDGE